MFDVFIYRYLVLKNIYLRYYCFKYKNYISNIEKVRCIVPESNDFVLKYRRVEGAFGKGQIVHGICKMLY